MKRLVGLFLALILLCGCTYGVVEENVTIAPELQNSLRQKDAQGREVYVLSPAGEETATAGADGEQEDIVPSQQATATGAAKEEEVATPAPFQPITNGSKGDAVQELQQRLKTLGFLQGAADATFGAQTEAAIRDAQQYLNDVVVTEIKNSLLASGTVPETDPPSAQPTEQAEATAQEVQQSSLDTMISQMNIVLPHEANGIADENFITELNSDQFPLYQEVVQSGSKGINAKRVQTRLAELNYMWGGIDGAFGSASESALKEFQRLNSLEQNGIADEKVQQILFSDRAIKSDRPPHPYFLKVSTKDQRVYVYAWENDDYTNKVKTMVCSTGLNKTPTPKGTYSGLNTGPGARWHYFKKFNCYAQYAYYIQGDIMFHSVLYNSKSEKSLSKSSVRNLGKKASHGCVRLSVEDAKWIWNNCPPGTTVVVY